MIKKLFRNFLELDTAASILLFASAILAVVFNNTDALIPFYQAAFHQEFSLGPLHSPHSATYWINDALMVLFFFLVGMEIKREIVQGALSTRSSMILPAVAAVGGMAVPACIYVAFNHGHAAALAGWAIPSATDIAFALGVLMLLGSRVPVSLKVFLTALAILDDLGAILMIALFYTAELSGLYLGLAVLVLAGLTVLNRCKVTRFWPYAVLGLLLWLCVLNSGVHATVAGVLLAFAIPIRNAPGQRSLLDTAMHALHPWVSYLILPLFAFANAGLSLQGMSINSVLEPIPLGIAAGLFIGKQVGIFGTAYVAIRLGWARLPAGASWLGLYAVSILCGIGFTMSLFIGSLAFSGNVDLMGLVQLGVFAGSLLAMGIGLLLLYFATDKT